MITSRDRPKDWALIGGSVFRALALRSVIEGNDGRCEDA
jgi:hypothetical protein